MDELPVPPPPPQPADEADEELRHHERSRPGSGCLIAFLVALPIFYVLSPPLMMHLVNATGGPGSSLIAVVSWLYYPLEWLYNNVPWIRDAYDWYFHLTGVK